MQRSYDAAAPPDAGGHLGAFTRPDELLQADDDPGPRPLLHRIDARTRKTPTTRRPLGRAWLVGVAAALLTMLIIAYAAG